MEKSYRLAALVTLMIGLTLVLVLPFALTRSSFTGISFNHGTGEIGDTIGGITAPIIGLTSAILLFFALMAQVRANKLVTDQFAKQEQEAQYERLRSYLLQQVELIRDEIRTFSITSVKKGILPTDPPIITRYTGFEGIQEILVLLSEHHDQQGVRITVHPELLRVQQILIRLTSIIKDERIQRLHTEDRHFLLASADFTYRASLYPILCRLESHRVGLKKPCASHGVVHDGLPEELYVWYDELNALLDIKSNELIEEPLESIC